MERPDILARVTDLAAELGLRRPGVARILAGPVALARVVSEVKLVRLPGRVMVLTDATDFRRGDDDLKAMVLSLLADLPVDWVTIGPASGRARVDEASIGVATQAAHGAGCLVTIGSGTVTGLGKLAAGSAGVPLVAVQTAASTHEYPQDSVVVWGRAGTRRMTGAWPTVLVIDDLAISSAPPDLNRVGVGELMAMFTAPADWLLSAELGLGPVFHPQVVELYRGYGSRFLAAAPGVGTAEPASLDLVADLLTTAGLAVGVCESPQPLSGLEHAVCGLLDIAIGSPTSLDGATIGVTSAVVSCLWETVLSALTDQPGQALPPDDDVRRRVTAVGERVGEDFWGLSQTKRIAWESHPIEASLRQGVGPLLEHPGRLIETLAAAGAPTRFSALSVGEKDARWALENAHLVTAEFTVLDLAEMSGMDVGELVEVSLARAAALGGGL